MNMDMIIDKEVVIYTLLMTFVLKVVVFILGFLTIKMGFALMKDGIKGGFKFSTEAKGIKGALESGSPGLLFVLLGILLIGYAMFVKKGVDLSAVADAGPGTEKQAQAVTKDTGRVEDKPGIGNFDTTKKVDQ